MAVTRSFATMMLMAEQHKPELIKQAKLLYAQLLKRGYSKPTALREVLRQTGVWVV